MANFKKWWKHWKTRQNKIHCLHDMVNNEPTNVRKRPFFSSTHCFYTSQRDLPTFSAGGSYSKLLKMLFWASGPEMSQSCVGKRPNQRNTEYVPSSPAVTYTAPQHISTHAAPAVSNASTSASCDLHGTQARGDSRVQTHSILLDTLSDVWKNCQKEHNYNETQIWSKCL